MGEYLPGFSVRLGDRFDVMNRLMPGVERQHKWTSDIANVTVGRRLHTEVVEAKANNDVIFHHAASVRASDGFGNQPTHKSARFELRQMSHLGQPVQGDMTRQRVNMLRGNDRIIPTDHDSGRTGETT